MFLTNPNEPNELEETRSTLFIENITLFFLKRLNINI